MRRNRPPSIPSPWCSVSTAPAAAFFIVMLGHLIGGLLFRSRLLGIEVIHQDEDESNTAG